MTTFRTLLIGMTAGLAIFTIAAISTEGINLLPHFLSPILAMTWQGQFNLDFSAYLVLSGIWMAWRGGFTGRSIALGLCVPPLGMLFFAPYLVYLSRKTHGDPQKLLMGVHAR
ncbi:hypothetical protein [Marivita geojedonensis]|uniref:DUF2834 domain-containing protein n=1 Tax=Marivita geojedonensis TaxID=1123756 RepID=A0A1X4ND18_9RHOB|nr:hypothetical protein [Marivita geojedonensis]OSQ44670.1 hypothetical protein MGEO_18805 [Marivita geojedonensis]PRY76390.1 hypothetical protein CLV76_11110 [Marivita geojedonensis]